MSFCMLASCFETDLLSRNTQPLPPPHPPNHLPAPPLRRAPDTNSNRMSTQGRPRRGSSGPPRTGGRQAHHATG